MTDTGKDRSSLSHPRFEDRRRDLLFAITLTAQYLTFKKVDVCSA
jgi:hypothetical protein